MASKATVSGARPLILSLGCRVSGASHIEFMTERQERIMRLSATFLIPLCTALAIGAYVKQLAAAKIAHEATAIVKRKEYVRYDEINHSFIDDDGYRIERTPGDEEWRVYYQIGEFRGFDEHTCKRLLEAEEDRAASGKPRYTILFKDEYDKIDIGDSLTVIYQRITNKRLIIDTVIDFRKPEK